jgi:ribosome modulation factor
MTTKANDDFRLSRIESEGWNTAQRYMAEKTGRPNDIRIAEFNPYRGDPARSRWVAGFRKAVTAMDAK